MTLDGRVLDGETIPLVDDGARHEVEHPAARCQHGGRVLGRAHRPPLAIALVGLALIPLGLPGLWLIVLGIAGYGWLTDFRGDHGPLHCARRGPGRRWARRWKPWIGFRFAQRYGGSRRAGWGALAGGLAGALVGVPVPLIGSVIGGFVGAFIGAALFEYTNARKSDVAARAGWGAVLGRAAAAAIKMGLGVVMTVGAIYLVLRR